jgi:hypothetical protein
MASRKNLKTKNIDYSRTELAEYAELAGLMTSSALRFT